MRVARQAIEDENDVEPTLAQTARVRHRELCRSNALTCTAIGGSAHDRDALVQNREMPLGLRASLADQRDDHRICMYVSRNCLKQR